MPTLKPCTIRVKDYPYHSNGGRGFLVARMISDDGETVELAYKDCRKPDARDTFTNLPSKFFYGHRCGWKIPVKIESETP